MDNERIAYLLEQYLADSITASELQELKACLLQDNLSPALQEALASLIDQSPVLPDYKAEDWQPLYQRIRMAAAAGTKQGNTRARLINLFTGRWAVAVLLIFLAAGSWLFFHRPGGGKEMAVQTPALSHGSSGDITPGSTKAVLTLADGSTVDLNAAGNGLVGQQGNAKLVKHNGGQLVYEAASGGRRQTAGPVAYNMITTPKGGEYQLILPDGSKVWLNAASSLRYPTAFSGNERVVELKGEAYFEVASFTPAAGHGKIPFRVHIAPSTGNGEGMDVQVLGTHFNVMAYADEQSINTTLLEGAVKLVQGNKGILIRPGEQGKLKEGDNFRVAPADIDEVIAWKNGLFRFNEATIEEVMRQIARWYDVEVVYVNSPPKDLFRGEIYRNVNMSKILKVLEASGVHFTVEGKKILVRS